MCAIMSYNKSYGMKITRVFFFPKVEAIILVDGFFLEKRLLLPVLGVIGRPTADV